MSSSIHENRNKSPNVQNPHFLNELLLMEEIRIQLIGSLSHYSQGFVHSGWLSEFLNHQQYQMVPHFSSLIPWTKTEKFQDPTFHTFGDSTYPLPPRKLTWLAGKTTAWVDVSPIESWWIFQRSSCDRFRGGGGETWKKSGGPPSRKIQHMLFWWFVLSHILF